MKSFLAVTALALASCSTVSTRSSVSIPSGALAPDPSARSGGSPASVEHVAARGDNLNTASKDNRLSIYLGRRKLDTGDYEPVEKQGTIGVEFAHEKYGDGIGWEVAFHASEDKDDVGGIDIKGRTREVSAGLRKTFGDEILRPFVGVGAAFINSEIEGNGNKDDDSSLAAYAHLGIGADVSSNITLGLDLRFLFGSSIDLSGANVDADYQQLALFVGFAF